MRGNCTLHLLRCATIVALVAAALPSAACAQAPQLRLAASYRTGPAEARDFAPPTPPREWTQVPPDLIAMAIPSLIGGALTLWWGMSPGCSDRRRLWPAVGTGVAQLAIGVGFSSAWIAMRRRRTRESGGRASRHPAWASRGVLAVGLGISAVATMSIGTGFAHWVACNST